VKPISSDFRYQMRDFGGGRSKIWWPIEGLSEFFNTIGTKTPIANLGGSAR